MSAVLARVVLTAVVAAPLILLLGWVVPRLRSRIAMLVPWAPLPALLVALTGEPADAVSLEWLFFGGMLSIAGLSRLWLLFTAFLWLGAGICTQGALAGDPRAGSFRVLWLATMAGNLGLIVAGDVGTFYASFVLMTFAGYGLVIHARSEQALRAGRVYLGMAVIGEAFIVAGLILAASQTASPTMPLLAELPAAVAGSEYRDATIFCLLIGFGVKSGAPLLHMWLPLAHPVAPVPASAVLSGAMIKAGLLGWLKTLPLGLVALPEWGIAVIVAGFVAAFGAAAIGVHQRTPKTVLAYSSIGQMGIMILGVGAGLHHPRAWPILAPAVAVYALHHGLAKGALFLAVDVASGAGSPRRRWLWVFLGLPAVSLAGLMVSGAVAKLSLKGALGGEAVPVWWSQLPLLLGVAALATTLLMARYLWLLSQRPAKGAPTLSQWLGWAVVWGASTLGVLAWRWLPIDLRMPSLEEWFDLSWPVAVALIAAFVAYKRLRPLAIPAGDWLSLLVRLFDALAAYGEAALLGAERLAAPTGRASTPEEHPSGRLQASVAEQHFRRNATLLFAIVLLILVAAAHFVRPPG